MFICQISYISAFRIHETEQKGHLIAVLIVIPQFICLYERRSHSVIAYKILYIRVCNSQQDSISLSTVCSGLKI